MSGRFASSLRNEVGSDPTRHRPRPAADATRRVRRDRARGEPRPTAYGVDRSARPQDVQALVVPCPGDSRTVSGTRSGATRRGTDRAPRRTRRAESEGIALAGNRDRRRTELIDRLGRKTSRRSSYRVRAIREQSPERGRERPDAAQTAPRDGRDAPSQKGSRSRGTANDGVRSCPIGSAARRPGARRAVSGRFTNSLRNEVGSDRTRYRPHLVAEATRRLHQGSRSASATTDGATCDHAMGLIIVWEQASKPSRPKKDRA